MEVTRRDFVLMTAAACAGCASQGNGPSAPQVTSTVDAGPAGQFAAGNVYDQFANQGFFLVSEGGKFTALSSVCTHRACKLRLRPDHSFYCKCHGSTFTEAGKVTKGPAFRDLPQFPIATNDAGHLIVQVTRPGVDAE